jgi:hypothetical protein
MRSAARTRPVATAAVAAVAIAAVAGLAGCAGGDDAAVATTTVTVTAAPTTATTPATSVAGGAAGAGAAAAGFGNELIRQFLSQFGGGVEATDAEISCVTAKLPGGSVESLVAEFTKPGGNMASAVAPALKAVAECKPASVLDAVGRQLTQADPSLALSREQSGCVVTGFLDTVSANPSLVEVVLGGTRIGGLPADVRTRITGELAPKVQACVGATAATKVIAAIERL